MQNLFIRSVSIKDTLREDDSYITKLPAVRGLMQLGVLEFPHPVTFLVGENGSGKSTLLEAIAVACGYNAEGGTRNFNFSTQATHSNLHDHLRLSRGIQRPRDGFFLRAESFYNVSSNIDELDSEGDESKIIGSYGGVSLHEQSHGESFMSLITNRFGGDGLYILDEPEAALSPTRQMALLAAIDDLVHSNSQFIIATHSPIVMAYPDAEILVLDESGITPTPYTETEHYIVTKQFLNSPDSMLRYLVR